MDNNSEDTISALDASLNDLRNGNLTEPISVDDYLAEVDRYQ